MHRYAHDSALGVFCSRVDWKPYTPGLLAGEPWPIALGTCELPVPSGGTVETVEVEVCQWPNGDVALTWNGNDTLSEYLEAHK